VKLTLYQGRQGIAIILLGPLDDICRARRGAALPREKAERLSEAIPDFRPIADLDTWLARNA
jgi:hypothetical protein